MGLSHNNNLRARRAAKRKMELHEQARKDGVDPTDRAAFRKWDNTRVAKLLARLGKYA